MTVLSAHTIAQVRVHANRLAERIEGLGLQSSAVNAFMAELGGRPSHEHTRRLQSLSAEIEQVLSVTNNLHLADIDLPRIRYLLTGAEPGKHIDPAEVARELAPVETGDPGYSALLSAVSRNVRSHW